MVRFILSAFIAFSINAFSSEKCENYFSNKSSQAPAAENFETPEKVIGEIYSDLQSDKTLQDIFKTDPDLLKLSQNKDFLNFVVGLAEGRTLSELEYSLFRIWKSGDAENINLNKALTQTVLENVGRVADKPVFQTTTRLQRYRYNLASLRVQIANLFKTLGTAKKIIREEMSPETLDARMFDFYGYLNLKLDVSAMRPWHSIVGSFGAIQLGQVKRMNPANYSRVAMMASEIEEPVHDYSDSSGEIFRVMSPQASRFMGKTLEETQAYREKSDRRTCNNSWCVEENRHEGTLARIAQSVSGWSLPSVHEFTNYPNLNPMNPRDVFFHLIARNGNEWHASSAYFLMAAHSEGPLRDWVVNILRDELKHLSLFGGFYKYLKGETYNSRLGLMIRKMWEEVKEKSSGSEYGKPRLSDAMTLFEVVYIHIKGEQQIRSYLKTLPLKSLRKIFETEINLKPLESAPIPEAKQAELEQGIQKEAAIRQALARWPKAEREAYHALEYFEIRNNRWMSEFIVQELKSFSGGESYGSASHKELTRIIESLTAKELMPYAGVELSRADMNLFKQSLKETLRDYQIFNNKTVRDLGLTVQFKDAATGFDIVKDAAYDAAKKVRENR